MNDDTNQNQEAITETPKPIHTVKENIKSPSIWLRLFFMFVIAFIYGVTRMVLAAVVVIQFFCVLFTAEKNEDLKKFGQQIASYTYQVIRFLTFNTEDRPFPFDLEWPKE